MRIGWHNKIFFMTVPSDRIQPDLSVDSEEEPESDTVIVAL